MSPGKKPSLPVDIYIRVSEMGDRDEDDPSFISADVQEERCRAQLEADGVKAGEVFPDLDKSGKTQDRPNFNLAMDRVRDGISGGIVVLRLNRFGRRTIGVLRDIAEIEEHGGVFISVEEKLDTSTAAGRFVLRMFAALAELELDRIDEGWQAAHREHIKRGVSTGRTPAGYTKPVTKVKTGGRAEYGPLVPNEHADAIREAFRMKAEDRDVTWRQLAAFLTERGVPNQKGGPWSGNAARQLILNRVYLGEVRHNDHVNRTAHEPILKTEDGQPDERIFRLAGAKKRRFSGDRGNGHLLGGGLVRCGICGAGMVKTRSTVSATQSEFLRCQTPGKGHPTIQVGAIEQYLALETLTRVKMIGAERVPIEVPEEIRDRLTIVLSEIEELGDMLDRGDIKPVVYAKAVGVAEKEVAELRETIASYEDGEFTREVSPAGRRQHEGAMALIEKTVDLASLNAWRATNLDALPPADVRKARQLIRETLGTITLAPGRGPVETRVSFPAKAEESAAA